MQLQVMIVGSYIMLCDEAGRPLPGQRRVTTKTNVDGEDTITVEFVINGDGVRYAGELAEAVETGKVARAAGGE
jgi:hypothetical protein